LDLDLNIGDVLHLELLQAKKRVRVRMIGLVPGRSLVVTAPEPAIDSGDLGAGTQLSVRVFTGPEVLAFACEVQCHYEQPFPHLHLTYPHALEQTLMRQARRARVHLPATAEPDSAPGTRVVVSLHDISTLGAQVWSAAPLGEVGEAMMLRLPMEPEPDSPQPVELVCEIRNVKKDTDVDVRRWRYGVEFATMSSATSLAVRTLVMRQLQGPKAEHK
jgi:hypothetical protein